MAPKNLTLECGDDGVAVLRLHVADSDHNHFSPGLAADLYAAVEEVQTRADIRGAVLTSARDNGFLAGAKLGGLLQGQAAAPSAPEVAALLAPIHGLMRRIETGKPIVAAMNGSAFGGGFELALACHHRLLSDDAELWLPEVAAGLIPGGGGTQRLPRLIGIAAALPLLLGEAPVSALQALTLGLVHDVLPREQLLAAARRWVISHPTAAQPWDTKDWRIPGGAGALAPHAVASFGLGLARIRRDGGLAEAPSLAVLEAVYEGTQLPIDRALSVEAACFAALVTPQPAETPA